MVALAPAATLRVLGCFSGETFSLRVVAFSFSGKILLAAGPGLLALAATFRVLSCFSGEILSLRVVGCFSFSGEIFSLVVGCFSFTGEILLAAPPGLLPLDVDFLLGARVTGVISLTTRAGLGEDLKGEIKGELPKRIIRLGEDLLPILPLEGVRDLPLLFLLVVLPTADLER